MRGVHVAVSLPRRSSPCAAPASDAVARVLRGLAVRRSEHLASYSAPAAAALVAHRAAAHPQAGKDATLSAAAAAIASHRMEFYRRELPATCVPFIAAGEDPEDTVQPGCRVLDCTSASHSDVTVGAGGIASTAPHLCRLSSPSPPRRLCAAALCLLCSGTAHVR
jgi:hypothetical protein